MRTPRIPAFLDHTAFAQWSMQPWKRRGSDYETLKRTMTEALLGFVERRHPGFTALVNYSELGTPLTFEHFSNHPHGAVYGLPAVPERYIFPWLGIT